MCLVTAVPEPERSLSPARTSVHPAPAAPYGLAPYGICGRFPPLLTQTRKPSTNTIGQRADGRFRVGAVVNVVPRPEGMMVMCIFMYE